MKTYNEIIKNIRKSIGFIVAIDEQGNPVGTGSGFVLFDKNILVTCNHVVKSSSLLSLKFPDQTEFIPAKVILRDEEHDLALVSFQDESREPLQMGKFEDIEEGAEVLFSGYPFSSMDLTTHQGIISAIIKDDTGITSFTIDGTISPGNSGCPLLTLDGKVIGVVNATRRNRMDLLSKVQNMPQETIKLHGVDLVEIYQVLIANLQLGMGFAIPAIYIPEHKTIKKKTKLK